MIGSATVALNFLFSFMFYKYRKDLLTRNNNKILLAMTIADGLVGIFCVAFGTLLIMKQPQIIYKLIGVLPLFCSMFTSIFLLGIMTVDRLVAIKMPLRYKTIMHRGRVMKVIMLSCIIAGYIGLQEAFVYIFVSWEFELRLRGVLLFVLFTSGSMLLMISNIHLSVIIRKHVNSRKNQAILTSCRLLSEGDEDGDKKRRTLLQIINREKFETKHRSTTSSTFYGEIRASRMCIMISALFICCWAPLTAYRFCYSVNGRIGIPWLRRVCLMLASLNSLINPLIYLMTRKVFRTYMRRVFLDESEENKKGIEQVDSIYKS